MLTDFCTNPVLLSVVILLILSALRLNVVFSLVIAALCGGMLAGMNGTAAMKAFTGGLGNGAAIAFNYAMLGAFSIAISRSGVTELIARELFKRIGGEVTKKKLFFFKTIPADAAEITSSRPHRFHSGSDSAPAPCF